MILLNGKEVKFDTFPNGETKLVEKSLKDSETGRDNISFKYENDGDLIKLMFLKKYLDSKNIAHHRTLKILTIYYMPYSRMDRSEKGSAFTLKYVADFINSLKFDHVDIIEPHSDVTPALIDNSSSIMVNFNLIHKVMSEVEFDKHTDYLVFPDSGAQKRYSKIGDYNTLVGFKDRDFETGRIKSLDIVGDRRGTGGTAIIVDDLSSYGGTFILTAEVLKITHGFSKVYLLVAHAEKSIFRGQLLKATYSGEPLIDKVFTTNTILDDTEDVVEYIDYSDKLEIYDIKKIGECC